jgi:hypothetical protein
MRSTGRRPSARDERAEAGDEAEAIVDAAEAEPVEAAALPGSRPWNQPGAHRTFFGD